MRRTSGQLSYSEVKGLHRCNAPFWIDIGLIGWAFQLEGPDGNLIASLDNRGRLRILPGYMWDGSSGPTIDGAADPVPSGVHDVLYEAIRTRRLPMDLRPEADRIYRVLLRERGMSRTRAGWRWLGLRLFGRWAASPNKGPEYARRVAL